MLQNVIEEVCAPRLNASKCNVTGKNPTRERFEQVFLANYTRVVSVLRRIVGDHARAEDLANEVFLRLYRQPMPTDAIENVPGWLYRTARNQAAMAVRSEVRPHTREEEAASMHLGRGAAG